MLARYVNAAFPGAVPNPELDPLAVYAFGGGPPPGVLLPPRPAARACPGEGGGGGGGAEPGSPGSPAPCGEGERQKQRRGWGTERGGGDGEEEESPAAACGGLAGGALEPDTPRYAASARGQGRGAQRASGTPPTRLAGGIPGVPGGTWATRLAGEAQGTGAIARNGPGVLVYPDGQPGYIPLTDERVRVSERGVG